MATALPIQASTTAPRPAYQVRLASSSAELGEAQALRFEVFNLELDEGLVSSYETGLDADPFDPICDHILVEESGTGKIVGTYRLQCGEVAARAKGYYSAREFDLSKFEPMRAQIIELGRACIHRDHRNFSVLNLLWKGIASYAEQHRARYLMGCSSLTSQSEAVGIAAYELLKPHLAPSLWRTQPMPGFACEGDSALKEAIKIPKLLSAYLALGASICGPPAIDREFKTIDFLTWLDIESPRLMALRKRGRFVA
jgi:putative hemolysin